MHLGRIVVLIPARGGSKGIPRKNLRKVGGDPLVGRCVKTALGSRRADEVWVSTDDAEIAKTASRYGANILERPSELAGDMVSTEDAMLHFSEHVDFDIVVLMQATSPLTISEDIDNAVSMMDDFDSVLSVCEDHGGWLCSGFRWFEGGIPDYDPTTRPMRQHMRKAYRENGALWVTHRAELLRSKCRISGRIGLYVMPRWRSFEIDEPEDLLEINKLLSRSR